MSNGKPLLERSFPNVGAQLMGLYVLEGEVFDLVATPSLGLGIEILGFPLRPYLSVNSVSDPLAVIC